MQAQMQEAQDHMNMQADPSQMQNAGMAQQIPVQNASLYVGDLHPDVNEATLYEIFNAMGPVVSVRVCRDAITRRSLGYAYVNFHNMSDAERAIETLNYTQIRGRPCRIMWSQRDPSLRRNGEGNVFVKHLDLSIDNKALYDTFSLFGHILSCKVVTDEKGKSRGYGFVHFETPEAADEAIRKINGMLLAGKEVYVGKFLKKHDRPNAKDWTNIYVKNIPLTWTKDDLEREFSKFGEISSAIIMEEGNGKSKGFGFIDFAEHEGASRAIEEMDGKDVREGDKKEKDEKEKENEDSNGDGKTKDEGLEGVLVVCRAQKKGERERELSKKFEQLKIERQSKYQGVNLYVKNLDDSVDDDLLRREFEAYGDISSAKVMTDKTGASKGFGFVCFETPDEAVKAVNEMNGKLVMGKPLYVALAQRKDQRRVQLEAQHRRVMNVPPAMFPYGAPQMHQMGMNPQMMRQQQQMMRQMPPQMRPARQPQFNSQARNVGMEPPLNLELLANASQQQRKNMLGEKLYPMVMAIEPRLAAKITGMLLEMENNEVLQLLESPTALMVKVREALEVLKNAASGGV